MRVLLHVQSPGEVIWRLAEQQYGVVARWQLLELSLDTHSVQRALEGLRLHPIHRGVYAVGHRRLTSKGRMMAAALAAGRPAILSHRSAGYLERLLDREPRLIEVTVPGARRSLRSIKRCGNALERSEVLMRNGLPITIPTRTILDLSSVLSITALERVVARAIHRHKVTEARLRGTLATSPGRRGAANLRNVLGLGRTGKGETVSPLEDTFPPFLDAYDLPWPDFNVGLELEGTRIVVDCLWRRQRVVAELDSWEHHGDRAAQEADKVRDRLMTRSGLRPIRITSNDIGRRPAALADDLRAILVGRSGEAGDAPSATPPVDPDQSD